MPNWISWSRRIWTRRCSGRARCRSYQVDRMASVRHPLYLPRPKSSREWRFVFMNANEVATVKGKNKAPVEEEDEEAELRKLQAEMAM